MFHVKRREIGWFRDDALCGEKDVPWRSIVERTDGGWKSKLAKSLPVPENAVCPQCKRLAERKARRRKKA